jgi:hypothetical protein
MLSSPSTQKYQSIHVLAHFKCKLYGKNDVKMSAVFYIKKGTKLRRNNVKRKKGEFPWIFLEFFQRKLKNIRKQANSKVLK